MNVGIGDTGMWRAKKEKRVKGLNEKGSWGGDTKHVEGTKGALLIVWTLDAESKALNALTRNPKP